ncbi:hypothetical protein BKD03_07255 [Brucella sp. 09RB8471]|nr:hypothetical protein BKD03_07255 [Brucella sp. 09RB8471]
MWWVREILSSLRFLAIEGDQRFWHSKRVYEFAAPLVATVLFLVLTLRFPQLFVPNFLANMTDKIFQFMVFVVPFHLAALVALSTFQRRGLDEKLAGTNAQVKVWSNIDSNYFYEVLTLRQYVSLLYGYLCTIGIGYIISYILASNLNTRFIYWSYKSYITHGLECVIIFFISHYTLLTIYSITFLFEKINKVGKQTK